MDHAITVGDAVAFWIGGFSALAATVGVWFIGALRGWW